MQACQGTQTVGQPSVLSGHREAQCVQPNRTENRGTWRRKLIIYIFIQYINMYIFNDTENFVHICGLT